MPQISIIKKSDILKARRFDAEYFKPEYLEIERKLKKINSLYLNKVVRKFTNGVEVREFEEKGNPYIRVSNTSNDFFVNFNDVKFISRKNYKEHNKKYKLNKNDLLLNRSGTLGYCQVIDFEDSLFSSHNIRLSEIRVNSYYLCSFLNSYFGKKQILRHSNGALVPEINHIGLNLILVPILPQPFQLQIEKIVKESHQKQTQSKQLYKQAEQILLKELNLIDFEIKHRLTFTTTKKEIDQAKRFDSEYFQPKYEEIIKHIENYQGGFDVVKNIFNFKKGIEPGSEFYTKKGKDFVRVSDFSMFEIEDTAKKISAELFKEIKSDFQPKKGEILFTKDGTIGIASVLNKNLDGVLSSAFLRLTLRKDYLKFEKEFLALILNSVFCKMQVEKLSGGALIAHLKPSDFQKFKIPLIKTKIQKKIAEKITQSHLLRKESKELLELAKNKVEEEIEKEYQRNE